MRRHWLSDLVGCCTRWQRATLVVAGLSCLVGCAKTESIDSPRKDLAGPPSTPSTPVATPDVPSARLPRPRLKRSAASTTRGSRRLALVIGADTYAIAGTEVPSSERRTWNIAFARKSAERMAQALQEHGGFLEEDVKLLTGPGVTSGAIRAHLETTIEPRLAGDGNVLVVYYAGHGMADEKNRALLFTHETRPARKRAARFENALPFEELQAWIRELQERVRKRGSEVRTVSIVDACSVRVGAPPSDVVMEATTDVAIHSTRLGEFAHADVSGLVFTEELATALESLGARGEISLRAAFRQAASGVAGQTPWISRGTEDDEDVVLGRTGIPVSFAVLDGLAQDRGQERPVTGARLLLNGREPRGSLLATTYTISAEAPGYLSWETELEITDEDAGRRIDVPLYPGLVLVEGRVLDDENAPVSGQAVTVTGVDAAVGSYHETRTSTDRSGHFRLRLPRLEPELQFVVPDAGGQALLRTKIRDDTPEFVYSKNGLRVARVDLGTLRLAGTTSGLPEVELEITWEQIDESDVDLGIDTQFDFPELKLPDVLSVPYENAKRFARASRLERALDKLAEIRSYDDGRRLDESTRTALDDIADRLRVASALAQTGGSVAAGLTALREARPKLVSAKYAEALDRAAANLFARRWRDERESGLVPATIRFLDELDRNASRHARAHHGSVALARLREAAATARRRGELTEALNLVRLGARVEPDPATERALLRSIAREELEAKRFDAADWTLRKALESPSMTDEERWSLAADRAAVRERWIRSRIEEGYSRGNWNDARTLVENSNEIATSKALAELAAEIERESISPYTRRQIETANAEYRRGGAAALGRAYVGYERALDGANAHYREYIEEQLADIEDRLYALHANAAVAAELAGASEAELFEHRSQAARYRPVLGAREIERLWRSEEVRTEHAGRAAFVQEILDWHEALRDERGLEEPKDRAAHWERWLAARNPSARFERVARFRLQREREEAERLKREREEAERLKREREEAERLKREREEAERHLQAFHADIQRVFGTKGLPTPNGFALVGPNAQKYPEYLHEQTDIVFVLLPGGTFEMGSPASEPNRVDDEALHSVRISPFLIAKHELTQGVWKRVMGSNPSRFASAGKNAPVEQVSWDDIQDFEKRTGLTLPTEAQWESACRAGTRTPFGLGANISPSTVNYDGNQPYNGGAKGTYRETTVPVGSFPANGFGLHDMHGNVWEWCEDVYDEERYSKAEAANGDQPSTTGSGDRVFRGGGWLSHARNCRSALRLWYDPSRRSIILGFRPAFRLSP